MECGLIFVKHEGLYAKVSKRGKWTEGYNLINLEGFSVK